MDVLEYANIILQGNVMDVISQIQELGLTEIEARVYIAILTLKETTVLEIARHTAIKRATVHFNVENLINKGLVTQIKINNKRMIKPSDLDSVGLLLEKRKQELSKIEEGYGSLLENLKATYLSNEYDDKNRFGGIVSRYFEGKEAVKIIYDEAFSAKSLYSVVNLSMTARVFPENFEKFSNALRNKTLGVVREIIDHSELSEEAAKTFRRLGNYQNKYIDKEIDFKHIDLYLFEGKVAIIDTENQISGVIIEGKYFYNFMLSVFNVFWNKE